MISASPSLRTLSVSGSAHSFRMKQSSPFTFLSPMHRAPANMLAAAPRCATWSARRRGRTGPLAECAPSHGVWRHTSLPLQPACTLLPPTASSMYHISGAICHSTNRPDSVARAAMRFLTTRPPVSNSVATILTLPMAYEFLTDDSSFCPPEAARYCCRMYCADEVSCKNTS
ncbi:hypothetical protein EE612_060519 [Oryza sativa]|nr:hypothetical protein EE612_060519 [Oryza sativa]